MRVNRLGGEQLAVVIHAGAHYAGYGLSFLSARRDGGQGQACSNKDGFMYFYFSILSFVLRFKRRLTGVSALSKIRLTCGGFFS